MIGERLKKLRNEKKKTMQQVANDLAISVSTYQKYEYDIRDVSTDMLNILANYFEVTTDYLLGRPEAIQPERPIDLLIKEQSLHSIEESLLRMYFKLDKRKRAAFMQSVLEDAQKNVLAAQQKEEPKNMQTNTHRLNQQNIPITYEEPPPPRYPYQYASRGSNWQGQTMDLTDDELENLLLNSPEVPEDIFNK